MMGPDLNKMLKPGFDYMLALWSIKIADLKLKVKEEKDHEQLQSS